MKKLMIRSVLIFSALSINSYVLAKDVVTPSSKTVKPTSKHSHKRKQPDPKVGCETKPKPEVQASACTMPKP